MIHENELEDDLVQELLLDNAISEPLSGYNQQKDFTSLIAWQDARKVKLFFYEEVLPLLPTHERYGLTSQIKRAAISTTANIAEGYGRFCFREGIQYFRIAWGSLYELKDHLLSCQDIYKIDPEVFSKEMTLIEKAKISINGFIKYIQSKAQNR